MEKGPCQERTRLPLGRADLETDSEAGRVACRSSRPAEVASGCGAQRPRLVSSHRESQALDFWVGHRPGERSGVSGSETSGDFPDHPPPPPETEQALGGALLISGGGQDSPWPACSHPA